LRRIAAPESSFNIDGTEFYGKVSFLKAGCVYASHLTTVSATYAQEITTPEMGCGLDGLLRKRSEQNELTGILNGIDQTWDARTCMHLPAQFAAGDWAGKRSNTEHLRKEFGLSASEGPLFGVVARLVHQKGLDLVIEAADTIVSSGGQLVVMGRGEPLLEDALSSVSRRHPREVAIAIRFDDAEARRVFAGSDFTLMPSRFEPCGLSQMYAQRFASLPIGHRTGGLAETIKDGKTGFLFDRPMNISFLGAICRAFGTYARQTMMNAMREAAMGQDFQWQSSAASYQDLYTRLS
jgi:starch synthase